MFGIYLEFDILELWREFIRTPMQCPGAPSLKGKPTWTIMDLHLVWSLIGIILRKSSSVA